MSTHTHTHIVCRIPINLSPLYFYLELRLYCVQCAQLFPTRAPLPMEFSRQEYWTGLPYSSPGDLLYPGIKPLSRASSALACGFFTTWEAFTFTYLLLCIHILLCALVDLSDCQNAILFVLIPFVYVVRLSKIA